MDERKMIKAQPGFLVTAETRGLGLSEERDRRQLPQAVNDNGEEWPRASCRENASQARGQVPCTEGVGRQGYDAVRVVVIATKLGMRLTAPKADSNPETFTMLDLNSNALWEEG